MSVFGFIENFFFISLGIVFGLILLLVYHFKNRMAVAEKKSESMYGLLSAVVREIKSLRGLFGLGGGGETTSSNTALASDVTDSASEIKDQPPYAIQQKTTPEVIVETQTGPIIHSSNKEVINLDLSEFITLPREDASSAASVINNAPSQKIVVSDEESEYEDDSESDYESELEDDDDDDEEDEEPMQIDLSLNDDELKLSSQEPILEQDVVVTVEDLDNFQIVEENELATVVGEVEVVNGETAFGSEPAFGSETALSNDVGSVNQPQSVPTIEQLRKMNINQLKTIAIQSGITSDTSKLKKHELIALIHSSA